MLMFYFLAFWVLFCSSIRYYLGVKSRKYDFVYLLFCFLPLLFIVSQDSRPFADTKMYIDIFKDMEYRTWEDVIWGYDQYYGYLEMGYLIVTKFLYTISPNPSVYFFSFAITTYLMIAYFIYKESKDYIYSIILFFLLGYSLYPGIAIRQWVSIAIFLVAFNKFLVNKCYIKYCICIIIAAQIHMSAYALLVMPLYEVFKLDKRLKLTVLLMIVMIAVFYLDFSLFIGENTKYAAYMNDMKFQQGTSIGPGVLKIIFFWLGPLIVIYMNKGKRLEEEYPHLKWYILFSIMCILITIVQYTILFMVERYIHYFELFTIFIIPCFFSCIARKNMLIIKGWCLLLFILYYYLKLEGMLRGYEIEFIN